VLITRSRHYTAALRLVFLNSAFSKEVPLGCLEWQLDGRGRRRHLQRQEPASTEKCDDCQKATALLETTKEEPANANHRCLKAQAYRYLGEAYEALAIPKEVPPSETTHHWTAAREMFQRGLDIYEDMRSRGILGGGDMREPDEVTGNIAKCDAALRKSMSGLIG
jgi:hypothetical protein